jgi:hypothetical protein
MSLLSRIPRPSGPTHGRPLFLSIESRRRDTHGTRSRLVLIFQTMRTQVEGRHMLTRRVSHLNNGRCVLWGRISYLKKGRRAIYGGVSLLVKCLKKECQQEILHRMPRELHDARARLDMCSVQPERRRM